MEDTTNLKFCLTSFAHRHTRVDINAYICMCFVAELLKKALINNNAMMSALKLQCLTKFKE